ncbi:PDCD5-related protein [Hygrophoropsis aurantiaca]|uniref:PDCD5-related protein n=1 Tax=Hygrophoropsis aurantiaca TaxID=72124 RepID=A0ACB8AD81_9AGAM|nr:PDCD5-related protein [Hygrophoropsis aurantiaca]
MEGLSQLPPGMTPQNGAQGGEEEAKRKVAEEEMRRDMMATVLDTAARERLSRIALVSPERSRQIEMIIMRMAQSGQIRGRVSEQQLIDLLEQMEDAQSKSSAKKTTIVYQRRRDFDDDDDF